MIEREKLLKVYRAFDFVLHARMKSLSTAYFIKLTKDVKRMKTFKLMEDVKPMKTSDTKVSLN